MSENKIPQYTFQIKGMHCKACEILIEDEVKGIAGVESATASLKHQCVVVNGNFDEQARRQLSQEIESKLHKHGYSLSGENGFFEARGRELGLAVVLGVAFFGLFLLLQKLGIVNVVTIGSVSFLTAFVIGVIASLSTCMAVVGGLVLSLSASYAKEGSSFRPHILFHLGRIVSFIVLGGLVGALGSVIRFGRMGTFVLSMVVAVVMMMLALDLLGVPLMDRLRLTLPSGLSKKLLSIRSARYGLIPFFVGAITFVLPCGFTQSMQLVALTSGSFLKGSIMMTAFVFGTLPVLLLISFTSFSFKSNTYSGLFFKTAGVVILLFTLLNIAGSLSASGLMPPLGLF